jgi:type II secretory pathway pseudopilin PulG
MKKQNGITLVALVITIIVLLILAGVSLALVTSNSGIIKQASNAVSTQEKSTALEEVKMAASTAYTNYKIAQAENVNAVAKDSYDEQIFKEECSSATSVTVAFSEDGNTATVKYTGKSKAEYTFYINLNTNEVTETNPNQAGE